MYKIIQNKTVRTIIHRAPDLSGGSGSYEFGFDHGSLLCRRSFQKSVMSAIR